MHIMMMKQHLFHFEKQQKLNKILIAKFYSKMSLPNVASIILITFGFQCICSFCMESQYLGDIEYLHDVGCFNFKAINRLNHS